MRVLRAEDREAVVEATRALDAGELVVYPTDTLYGLGADALDERAVERVFDAKERPRDQALSVAVATFEEARHVAQLTPLARRLAARFLPGPLTLVLPALATVPDALVANGKTIAVRVPDSPFTRALAQHFGPVVTTSANVHGKPSPATIVEAQGQLGERVALYVDGGKLPGRESTIVDATGEKPRVLRVGALPAEEVGA